MSVKVGDRVRIKAMPIGTISGLISNNRYDYAVWAPYSQYEYILRGYEDSAQLMGYPLDPVPDIMGKQDHNQRRCPIEWLEVVVAAPQAVQPPQVGDTVVAFVKSSSDQAVWKGKEIAFAAYFTKHGYNPGYLSFYPSYETSLNAQQREIIEVYGDYAVLNLYPGYIFPVAAATIKYKVVLPPPPPPRPLPPGAQYLGFCGCCGGFRAHRMGCKTPKVAA